MNTFIKLTRIDPLLKHDVSIRATAITVVEENRINPNSYGSIVQVGGASIFVAEDDLTILKLIKEANL
jgi:hypothetical protein